MKTARALLITAICFVLSSCDDGSNRHARRDRREAPLAEAVAQGTVEPMADGSAYIVGADRAYYVNKGIAQQVTGFTEHGSMEVTPLADGSAIFVSSPSDTAYWVHGITAKAISEGDVSVSAAAASREGFYFVQAERAKKSARQANDYDPGSNYALDGE